MIFVGLPPNFFFCYSQMGRHTQNLGNQCRRGIHFLSLFQLGRYILATLKALCSRLSITHLISLKLIDYHKKNIN